MRNHKIDKAYEETDYELTKQFFNNKGFTCELAPTYSLYDYIVTGNNKTWYVEAKYRNISYFNDYLKPWLINKERIEKLQKLEGNIILFYAFPNDGKVLLYNIKSLNTSKTSAVNIKFNPSNATKDESNIELPLPTNNIRDFEYGKKYAAILEKYLKNNGVENEAIKKEIDRWVRKK